MTTKFNTYSVPCSAGSYSYTPAEYQKNQIKKYRVDKRYNIFWDEGMSDQQILKMMEFLDTKLDVMPVKNQEDFLDAELFEM